MRYGGVSLRDRSKQGLEAVIGAVPVGVTRELTQTRAVAAAAAAASAGGKPTTAQIQAAEAQLIAQPVPIMNWIVDGAGVLLWGAAEGLGRLTGAAFWGELGEGIGLPSVANVTEDVTHAVRRAMTKPSTATASSVRASVAQARAAVPSLAAVRARPRSLPAPAPQYPSIANAPFGEADYLTSSAS